MAGLPPERWHGARWVADEAVRKIEMAAREQRPFFVWASFQDTHNPYVCPEPWAFQYRPERMPPAVRTSGGTAGKPAFYAALEAG